MRRLLALGQIASNLKLALALVRDARVPLATKSVLVGIVAYVLSPFDLIPDWFPIVGGLDDLAALAAGLALFIKLCPPYVVEEHRRGSRKRGPAIINGQAWEKPGS